MTKDAARCPSCDGTGDVHRADGEWLGECDCGSEFRHAYDVEASPSKAFRVIQSLSADRDFWKERFQVETRARIEAEALSRTGAVEDAEAARDALRELANVKMDLSLEDWCRISNTILSTLEPAAPEDHKTASAASVDPDGIWERAYAETAGVQPDDETNQGKSRGEPHKHGPNDEPGSLAAEQSGETGPAAPEGQQEPVAWQRRQQYSEIPGYIPQWQFVSKEEATGHFERRPGYEYRPLFTRPSEQAVTDEMVEAACEAFGLHERKHGLDHRQAGMREALKVAMEAGRQALASSGGRT